MLREAITMAALAHEGQTDKSGAPYIFHPIRVASTFSDDFLQTIAVLHDVVEDTSITLSDLDAHFPQGVVNAVDALTRREGETYEDFIQRVSRNPSARKVKIADLRDNLRPGAPHLTTRYEKALRVLEEIEHDQDAILTSGAYPAARAALEKETRDG
ncbi:HD domain-containing protein [Shinella sp. JR1-6]|uniref:HD domain-containing protein n=1 Tax=Shinella sp. JR1-6 TaxID=2527671 RepID=UPI00102D62AD|nr:HD domain-containing protein [Shinella sp. JR1-6]TAA63583.1 HD domain-containing protein [Shinella sp. JR1-6]